MATVQSKVLFLTPREVCRELGISREDLADWRTNRVGLRFVEVGDRIYYWRIEVADLLANRAETPSHSALLA